MRSALVLACIFLASSAAMGGASQCRPSGCGPRADPVGGAYRCPDCCRPADSCSLSSLPESHPCSCKAFLAGSADVRGSAASQRVEISSRAVSHAGAAAIVIAAQSSISRGENASPPIRGKPYLMACSLLI